MKNIKTRLQSICSLKTRCLQTRRLNTLLLKSLKSTTKDYNALHKKYMMLSTHIGELLGDIGGLRRNQMETYQNLLTSLTAALQKWLPAEEVYQAIKVLDQDGGALFDAASELVGAEVTNLFQPEDEPYDGPTFKMFVDRHIYDSKMNSDAYKQYADKLWPTAISYTVGRMKYDVLDQVPGALEALLKLASWRMEAEFTMRKAG